MNKRLKALIFYEQEKGWQVQISDKSTGYVVEAPSPYFPTPQAAMKWARDKRAVIHEIMQ